MDVPALGGRRSRRRLVVAQGGRQARARRQTADRYDLLDEILAEPDARTAFGFEDDADLRAAFARHGFVQPGEQLHFLVRPLPEPPVPPPLPPGFGYRTVEPTDLAERVAIHRDVWAPSRVTESSYANVMAAWPYRGSLDCVVEAPDGRFAAYCLVWPDDENRVGEFEPVGVREAVQAARSRLGRLHVRPAAPARGGRSRGDRLLRERACLRALPLARLPRPRDRRRLFAMNRLAQETSPYLLQHAANPVDWYPWGDEAFAKARAEDKPVLLSVGYSACHWCHVMERESFEDSATAQVMNELYVSIKVDREERPDVDAVYMDAVVALTGQGGWPMTVFLTPAGEPFFGGTYYPPEPRHGLPAFRQVLVAIAEAYRTQRERRREAGEPHSSTRSSGARRSSRRASR